MKPKFIEGKGSIVHPTSTMLVALFACGSNT